MADLLPVGTVVRVTEARHGFGTVISEYVAQVVGYDIGRTKYHLGKRYMGWSEYHFLDGGSWGVPARGRGDRGERVRTTYSPNQVRYWTAADLDRLVGKLVVVNIRPGWGAGWLGDHGIVSRAVIVPPALPHIEFDHGVGCDWYADDEVYVSVCDEHGDHTSLNGVDCVDRFMLDATGTEKR